MKLHNAHVLALTVLVSAFSGVASAEISASCMSNELDCKDIVITSVDLKGKSSCAWVKNAEGPASTEPKDWVCDYDVEYKCDGKDKKAVVVSPARFGCYVEQDN